MDLVSGVFGSGFMRCGLNPVGNMPPGCGSARHLRFGGPARPRWSEREASAGLGDRRGLPSTASRDERRAMSGLPARRRQHAASQVARKDAGHRVWVEEPHLGEGSTLRHRCLGGGAAEEQAAQSASGWRSSRGPRERRSVSAGVAYVDPDGERRPCGHGARRHGGSSAYAHQRGGRGAQRRRKVQRITCGPTCLCPIPSKPSTSTRQKNVG